MKIFKNLIRGVLILALFFVMSYMPAFSKNLVDMHARISSDFSTDNIPSQIEIRTIKRVKLFDDLVIPQRSVITADVYQTQKEKRWHKSGFIICKVKSYLPETSAAPIDISDRELYLIARKYEKINTKKAVITGTEILLTQAASFFAPGVDILYFFTKGAILREKHPNWFRAGVSNAYENSICWFWLKGKPIDLASGQEIKLNHIKKTTADRIKLKNEIKQAKIDLKNKKAEAQNKEKIPLNDEISVANLEKTEVNSDLALKSINIVEATVDKNVNAEYPILTGSRSRTILVDSINLYTGRK